MDITRTRSAIDDMLVPEIDLQGIAPQDYLVLRNLVLEKGFFLDHWAFDKALSHGVLIVGGLEHPERAERIPFRLIAHQDSIKECMREILSQSIPRAELVLFANSMESFAGFYKNSKTTRATPTECAERYLHLDGKKSPVLTVTTRKK